jgi:hypothetical protein
MKNSEVVMKDFNPFENNVLEMEYVGSRVTCNPPPTDTDEDILILTDNMPTIQRALKKDGWDGTEMYISDDGTSTTGDFYSMRKGEINLIITQEKEFYDKFTLASFVCKTLNVMAKKDRITVFQAILYSKKVEGKP